MLRSATIAAALALAACSNPGSPCPACSEGQVCDPEKRACVTAIAEGAPCGAMPDGGTVEGACGDGLVCGAVGGATMRCTRECTARNAAQQCGTGRACFARPDGSGGFCATAAGEGELCDSTALAYCAGGQLTCVTASADRTDGKCFRRCNPEAPDCAQGYSCADPFPDDPTRGICVVPAGRYPSQCNYTALSWCGQGETCVRPTTEDFGYCHRRCQSAAGCATGEDCVSPETSVAFCVTPVSRCFPGEDAVACKLSGRGCSGLEDRWCAATDLCVRIGATADGPTVCKQDCTASGTCSGGICTALEGSTRKACL